MNSYWSGTNNDIDKPKWRMVGINKNPPHRIIVTWQEKYGNENTEECVGLWQNDSQYKLSYADPKTILIEKQNLNQITWKPKEI